jgi:hypothetical protein
MGKQDFLKECMSGFGGVPIDQFNQRFCLVCVNSECARSSVGSNFVKRVTNWEKNLFISPPRASENDPKYDNIRAKNFLSVEPDPITIHSVPIASEPEKTASMIEIMEEEPEPAPAVSVPIPESKIQEPVLIPEPKIQEPPAQQIKQSPPQVQPMNTPFQQGTMVSDKPKEVVMEPGSTFTFGGDDD